MLVDTDVLVWYLRGNEGARETIERLRGFSVSVVTYMELVQGLRDKSELQALRHAFRAWHAHILYIDDEISIKAMFLVEKHFLSHSLRMVDALIASTALTHGLRLLTANRKHYDVVNQLEVKTFQPA